MIRDKIIIVEDDPGISKYLQAALRSHGYDILLAPDGKTALEMISSHCPDVLLLDLGRARTLVKPEEVFAYVREHSGELLLPDQDVFNALYGSKTLPLPDEIWNYDPKYYAAYRLRSEGMCDLDWVMGHTVFLHFCGKHKPWLKSSRDRFSALYKHYMRLASR